jgi:hypothetical protein
MKRKERNVNLRYKLGLGRISYQIKNNQAQASRKKMVINVNT